MLAMDAYTRAMAQQWLDERRPAEVVVVLEAQGSVPRGIGTRMLVSAADAVGTVGGGHLEMKAILEARALLQSGSGPRSIAYPLGPALGQCCGGAVTLGFMRLDAKSLAAWPEPAPLFQLQMYGAGHVGQAVARLLSTIDCRVAWIDEREDQFPNALFDGAAWPPHIRTLCVDAVEDEVRHAPPNSFFLVLTHNHDLDLRLTEAILTRGDFAYFGLIGSRTKRARFEHRMRDKGIPPQRLARMTCPIGIEGVEFKEAELIAVAVVAQLLQAAKA
jgi:xanthine dehydrogenase accessory factor